MLYFRSKNITQRRHSFFLSLFPCLVCSNFQMEKTSSSWACTVITQLCLCFALYIALNLGHSQILVNNTDAPLDLYFISVNGGFRPFTQQSHLLHKVGSYIFLLHFFINPTFYFLTYFLKKIKLFAVFFSFFSYSTQFYWCFEICEYPLVPNILLFPTYICVKWMTQDRMKQHISGSSYTFAFPWLTHFSSSVYFCLVGLL